MPWEGRPRGRNLCESPLGLKPRLMLLDIFVLKITLWCFFIIIL